MHVVIVGGGFAGLAAARSFRGTPVQVTLVDRANHHLFQPLLYQVASAALAPGDIAEPIRSVLASQPNVNVRLGEVSQIDAPAKRVCVDGDWVGFDKLIIAAGARHAYFGHPEWEAHAPGLKTIADALEVRRRMLGAFERAEWTDDEAERERLLTFVVVGGGPTGVELAGAIRDIATDTLARDFKRVDTSRARVLLVEGGDSVLNGFEPQLQGHARAHLESLGVELRLGTFVQGIDAGGVDTNHGRIDAATVLWAAGNRASQLGDGLDVPQDRMNRVMVEADLSVPGHPDVFVVGDQAHFGHDRDSAVPGVAPAAMQMGQHAAANVLADVAGAPRKPFVYIDRGSMATIGRRLAVAQIGRFQFRGFVAWALWVFVHLMTLVGHRNRLVVFGKWAWAWLTYERSARLVWARSTRPDESATPKSETAPSPS